MNRPISSLFALLPLSPVIRSIPRIPLGIFNTRCFSIFSLLPFETLSSTRCCSRTLEFSRAKKERERERKRKKAETRRGNVYKYIYTAEERFAKPTVPTLVGGEGGHRVHEMPSFQREDNDRCENAHYILLINLTMRARRSRLTRVASVERAYVQGRGCGNERERGERKREMRTRRRRRKTLVGSLLLVKHPRFLFSNADLVPIPKLRLSYMPIQTSPRYRERDIFRYKSLHPLLINYSSIYFSREVTFLVTDD